MRSCHSVLITCIHTCSYSCIYCLHCVLKHSSHAWSNAGTSRQNRNICLECHEVYVRKRTNTAVWSYCSPAHVAAGHCPWALFVCLCVLLWKCSSVTGTKTDWETQRKGIKRKEWSTENGLCTGWRWIIIVFLSVPHGVLEPPASKEQEHKATSCSSIPVMEENLRLLSPGSCFYRSEHSVTFTIFSS